MSAATQNAIVNVKIKVPTDLHRWVRVHSLGKGETMEQLILNVLRKYRDATDVKQIKTAAK